MCKMKDVNVGIKKLDFTGHRGKMAVYLTDGREVIVPLSFFPDIKHLSVKEREGWMILDDQSFPSRPSPHRGGGRDACFLVCQG